MIDSLKPRFGRPIGPWFRWFAWFPVWTHDRGTIWLRMVWKRLIQKHDHLDGGADYWFQYSVSRKDGRLEE